MNIVLVVIPGPGARSVTLAENATVQDHISQENLTGRDIIINGRGVPYAQYATTTIDQNAEVFATASVKGNNS